MVEITGTFTWRDSLRAFWLSMRPRPVFAVVGICLGALAIGLLLVEWRAFIRDGTGHPGGLTYSLLVLLFVFLLYYPWKHYRAFKKSRTLSMPVTFRFERNAITISTELMTAKCPWSEFVSARENSHLYLLRDVAGQAIPIPKRFANTHEIARAVHEQLRVRRLV